MNFARLNFFCHTVEGFNFQLLSTRKEISKDMALLSEIRHTDRGGYPTEKSDDSAEFFHIAVRICVSLSSYILLVIGKHLQKKEVVNSNMIH